MLEENGKRKSLGRGLGALLGDEDIDLDMELNHVNVDNKESSPKTNFVKLCDIKAGKYQPRTEFDQEALESLAESIKDKGVLQPLLIRKDEDGKYEIIAGERRWRAAKLAGLNEVPVIIKDFTDKQALEVALVENLLRENLSAIEEAEGFNRLMAEFDHTQEALSHIVGKSRSQVANTLRLLNLPEAVQALVKENKLSAGHARALVGIENAEALALQIIQKDLNVRQTEEFVAKQKKPKSPKAERDADLVEIEKDLNKNLGFRIKISQSKQGGGKIVLQFASPAELDMILDILEQKKAAPQIINQVAAPVQSNQEPASTEKFTMKIID